ncbi:tRNA lysidine(34) synthetase TilS [Altererythrobacter aestiaquae]|uniref:tRNA(Ile)-lysidine synthase n=1 Tax=Pontixanthobacter aestiaquae TaxID=1509367 RepID=A0A844Z6F1_9SPHN|nr:tRNA lysidine(34) synthetase TilS [Pontixanthobacter aestiaquae]
MPAETGAIDPQLVERFRADLIAAWGSESVHSDLCKIGIAVSGGPDSVALLLLAHNLIPGRVEAATIDHQLREESAAEAKYVAQLCARLSIPHETIAVEVGAGNVQAKAREARYAALSNWTVRQGLAALATAHHADDQAETLLMRLNRGSGLAGLAGVRVSSWAYSEDPPGEFDIVRPLLGWRKSELNHLLDDVGIIPVCDPSNNDENFDRVRVRKALAAQEWLDSIAIAKSARLLGEMLNDVEHVLEMRRQKWMHEVDDGIVYIFGGGEAFEIENVHWIIERLGDGAPRTQIATMIDRLRSKQNASLAGVLARPIMFETEPDMSWAAWKFEPEPPRKTGQSANQLK